MTRLDPSTTAPALMKQMVDYANGQRPQGIS